MNVVLGLYEVNIFGINFGDEAHVLTEVFLLFALILTLHTIVNVRRTHLLSLVNSVSVWWHVVGVVAIILVLIFVPDGHQSFSFVFGHRINQSGFSGSMFWWYVLPLGFLLTQYTITGFDASAHISEETHGAAEAAPKGVWQSIFYSALIGWILLLAITFAVIHNVQRCSTKRSPRSVSPDHLRRHSMVTGWEQVRPDRLGRRPALLRRSLPDQRVAHVATRSRATATPRQSVSRRKWTVNSIGVPVDAVLAMAIAALIVTLPGPEGHQREGIPQAFLRSSRSPSSASPSPA